MGWGKRKQPAAACGCFKSIQNILTDFGEEQLAPSCCGTSRELAYRISVGYIEYQDLF